MNVNFTTFVELLTIYLHLLKDLPELVICAEDLMVGG
jgi:hypothetical protein